MRVGVGVGAVVLGGCDLVEQAKARVLGEGDAVAEHAVTAEVASAPAVEAAPAPEPLLLGRSGVAGVVEDAIEHAEAAPVPPPIEDLGRPRVVEPEGSRAFVPYDGGSLVSRPPSLGRVTAPAKPRARSKPRVVRPADEPCDPVLATSEPPRDRKWECLACGRG